MNETVKRALSGTVYIVLLLASILYSTESFFLLFGIFLLIAIFEFSNLIQVRKIIPLISGLLIYGGITLISHYRKETTAFLSSITQKEVAITINNTTLDWVLLVVTLVVSIKCILFLFYDSIQSVSTSSKYIYLLGYIILPFIFITKLLCDKPFKLNDLTRL